MKLHQKVDTLTEYVCGAYEEQKKAIAGVKRTVNFIGNEIRKLTTVTEEHEAHEERQYKPPPPPPPSRKSYGYGRMLQTGTTVTMLAIGIIVLSIVIGSETHTLETTRKFQICGAGSGGTALVFPKEVSCFWEQNEEFDEAQVFKKNITIYTLNPEPPSTDAYRCYTITKSACTSFGLTWSETNHQTKMGSVSPMECKEMVEKKQLREEKLLKITEELFSTNHTLHLKYSCCITTTCYKATNWILEIGTIITIGDSSEEVQSDLADMSNCRSSQGFCSTNHGMILWNAQNLNHSCKYKEKVKTTAQVWGRKLVVENLQIAATFSGQMDTPDTMCISSPEGNHRFHMDQSGLVVMFDNGHPSSWHNQTEKHNDASDVDVELKWVDHVNNGMKELSPLETKLQYIYHTIRKTELQEIKYLWTAICKLQNTDLMLMKLAAKEDGSEGVRIALNREDVYCTPGGDVYFCYKCKEIIPKQIHWNGCVERDGVQKCYELTPVTTLDNKGNEQLYFFNPGSKDLQRYSTEVDPNHLAPRAFKDNDGQYRTEKGTITVSKLPMDPLAHHRTEQPIFNAPSLFHNELGGTISTVLTKRELLHRMVRLQYQSDAMVRMIADKTVDAEQAIRIMNGVGKTVVSAVEGVGETFLHVTRESVNMVSGGLNTILQGPFQGLVNILAPLVTPVVILLIVYVGYKFKVWSRIWKSRTTIRKKVNNLRCKRKNKTRRAAERRKKSRQSSEELTEETKEKIRSEEKELRAEKMPQDQKKEQESENAKISQEIDVEQGMGVDLKQRLPVSVSAKRKATEMYAEPETEGYTIPSIYMMTEESHPEKFYVELEVKNLGPIKSFVDSGAVRSLCSVAVAQRLKKHGYKILRTDIPSMTSASHNSIPILGMIDLEAEFCKVNHNLRVYVMENPPADVLLGYSWLSNGELNPMKVNWATKTLEVNNVEATVFSIEEYQKLEKEAEKSTSLDDKKQKQKKEQPKKQANHPKNKKEASQTEATVSKTVKIPARTGKWVKVNTKMPEKDTVFEPYLASLFAIGLVSVSAIVSLKKDDVGNTSTVIPVANPTDKPVTLFRHKRLGNCMDFQSAPYLAYIRPKEMTPEEKQQIEEKILKEVKFAKTLSEKQKNEAEKLVRKRIAAFAWNEGDIGLCNMEPVRLELKPGCHPPGRQKPYRCPVNLREHEAEFVNELLDAGVVEYSTSSTTNPTIVLEKPKRNPEDKTRVRLVCDYRKTNLALQEVGWSLTDFTTISESLHGTKFMSKFDIKSGFYAIPLHPESRYLTAFETSDGRKLQMTRLGMGLSVSPALFSKALHSVLEGLTQPKQGVAAYIDDFLCYSETWEKHLKTIDKVLERMENAGIRLDSKKVQIGEESLDFLGYTLTPNGVKISQSKVEAINKIPIPKDTKSLQRFLGMANYNRKWIPNYASITKELAKMANGNGKSLQNWREEHTKAIEELKKCISEAGCLAFPSTGKNDSYMVTTDASSKRGMGCHLAQLQNNEERNIAFYSRGLHKSEKHYSATHAELTAIVWGLQQCEHLLRGTTQKIELRTDHRPLLWLLRLKRPVLPPKLIRYIMYLQTFPTLTITHISGEKNVIADILSRDAVPDEEEEPFNEECCKSCAEMDVDAPLFVRKRSGLRKLCNSTDLNSIEMSWKNETSNMQKAQKNDQVLGKIWKKLNGKEPQFSKTEEEAWKKTEDYWELFQGVIYYQGRIALPRKLIESTTRRIHEATGHFAGERTTAHMMNIFYWPAMSNDIKNITKACEICLRRKKISAWIKPPLKPIEKPNETMQSIVMDCVGPLDMTEKGNKYLITAICEFSGWLEAMAVPNIKAETVCEFLLNITGKFGLYTTLRTDLGANLVSEAVTQLHDTLGLPKRVTSTAYSPQTQGVLERRHAEVGRILHAYCSKSTQWDRYIDLMLLAMRSCIQETTGFSAFQIVYGKQVDLPVYKVFRPQKINYADEKTTAQETSEELRKIWAIAEAKLGKSQERMKEQYDKKVCIPKEIPLGSLIFIEKKNREGCQKLQDSWMGPYVVVGFSDSGHNVVVRAFQVGAIKTYRVHLRRIKLAPPGMIRPLDGDGDPDSEQDTSLEKEQESPKASHHYNLRKRPQK